MRKYSSAPHTNTTRNIASGMIVHVASSSVEPSIWIATGCFSLRYRIEKPNTSTPTRTMPITVIASRKKYSVSIHGATVDASRGKSAELLSHFIKNCHSTGLICIVTLYPFSFFVRS